MKRERLISKNGYVRCSLCDEWYFPGGEREEIHKHPEPQSGIPREDWLHSCLPYEQWIKETPEGRHWAEYRERLPQ